MEVGYKKLIVWQEAYKLRKEVYFLTKRFSKSEYRRVSQMNDAARSTKQNIQEGYKQRHLRKYIQYLADFARPSLAELEGDLEDCHDDGLISPTEYKKFSEHCRRLDYLFMRIIQALEKKAMNNKK